MEEKIVGHYKETSALFFEMSDRLRRKDQSIRVRKLMRRAGAGLCLCLVLLKGDKKELWGKIATRTNRHTRT